MPSGHAYRPGDIVTALNGKTIEITNTDAEGRLVLADALVDARRRGATHLVDLATLTGAVVVALGDFYAGLMGNDDDWLGRDSSAPQSASGDHAWRLPLHETYARYLKSIYADMKNSSDLRQAGPIYAARFLQEFAGEGPGRISTSPAPATSSGAGATTTRRRARRATASGCSPLLAERPRRAMNLDLGEERELLRRTVREFAEERIAPVAAELDREHRFPYEIVAGLAELGLMGIPIPERVRRRRARHAVVRARGRGARARRLVGGDHGRRPHLARNDADPPLRDRGAASTLASRPRLGPAPGCVRPDRAGRRLRRRGDANASGAS